MISIIVAMDPTGLIGNGDKLPWKVSAELKHFKGVTTGGVCVFGRKTYNALPHKPLADRENVVISHNEIYDIQYNTKEYYASSIENALYLCKCEFPNKQIFICGGRSLYQQTLPFSDRIYLSIIKGQHEGDVYFPGCPQINPRVELLAQGFTTTRYINQDTWDFYLLERFPVYNTV